MEKKIAAIPTRYNGYEFRSRTEARWAIFFDEYKVPFAYEPEGFALPSGVWYLPDFYAAEMDTLGDFYFEVKPALNFEDAALTKLETLVQAGKSLHAVLFDGPPDYKSYPGVTTYLPDRVERTYFTFGRKDGFDSIRYTPPIKHRPFQTDRKHDFMCFEFFSPKYIKAVEASRAARF